MAESVVDTMGLLFLLFTVLEVGMRVVAYSWAEFWSASNDVYEQTGNRYDFWVAAVSGMTAVRIWP
jgi:hypothetical protein